MSKDKTLGVRKTKRATIGTKIVGGVFLTAFAALTTTSLVASFMNFDATWATLTGKPVYTQEQADEYSKEQNKENTILLEKLNNELNLTKIALEAEQSINKNNVELLKQKQEELTNKTTEFASLQVENAANLGKITAYEKQINLLKEQLKQEQEKTDADKQTILSLNSQISTLETEKQNLENINTSNTNTINLLNSQVLNLNNTVTELTNNINKNITNIQKLTTQVNSLQESVKYYELLIGAYDFEDKAVITFEYNNSVYSLQVVDKGTAPTTNTPEDTDYIKFNYWMLNGVEVDISTLKPTENITLVANLTYYFDINYYDGSEKYSSVKVEQGQTPANLQLTNTAEKHFLGWSLDGVNVVNPSSIQVNETTNLYAVWDYAKEVKFVNGTEQVGNIQKAFNISELTIPTLTKTGYNFIGWTLDGETIVDLTNYELTTNVVFMAKFELIEHTITFINEGLNYSIFNYSVENNVINVTEPTKENYTFTYWSLENGKRINLSELEVDSDITLTAHYIYNQLIGTYYYRDFMPNSYTDEATGETYPCGADIYNLIINADGTVTYKKVTGVYNNRNDIKFAKILKQTIVTYDYIDFELADNSANTGTGKIQKFGYFSGRPGNQIFVEELTTVYTFTFEINNTLTMNKIVYEKLVSDSPWVLD